MAREFDHPIDDQFIDRWSPRSFKKQEMDKNDLFSILEAARWAPSCMNEQPWLLFYPEDSNQLKSFQNLLVPANKVWAENASTLLYLFARKNFKKDGSINRHAPFDCGAAWMSIALQARKLGFYSHAMAGIKLDEVYKAFNLSEKEYECMCAIAIGFKAEKELLPEKLQERESPSPRAPISDFIKSGFGN